MCQGYVLHVVRHWYMVALSFIARVPDLSLVTDIQYSRMRVYGGLR